MEVIDRLTITEISASEKSDWLFFRLTSSEGRHGWGEASLPGFHRQIAATASAQFRDAIQASALVGSLETTDTVLSKVVNPRDIVSCCAASGLAQAMADLCAQQANVAISNLFGKRVRTRVPMYANINRGLADRSPQAFARRAIEAVEAGFVAVKCAPFDGVAPNVWNVENRALVDQGLSRVGTLRRALDSEVAVAVDAHGRLPLASVEYVGVSLAEMGVSILEEPSASHPATSVYLDLEPGAVDTAIHRDTHRQYVEALKALRSHGMRIAGGEFHFGAQDFRTLIELDVIDIAMPDIRYCGGYKSVVEIAEVTRSSDKRLSMHNADGPIGTVASAQIASIVDVLDPIELQWGDVESWWNYVVPAIEVEAGQLVLPTETTGLGVVPDPAVLLDCANWSLTV